MAFTPRLTLPEKGNKYYITKSNGGYSTAIEGQPTHPDFNVLSNCFTGDTEIITREGVVRLDSIVDKTVEVLSRDGKYHTAIGGYYGKQPIFQIKFEDGSSFKCTENHRWIVFIDGEYVVKTTLELTKEDNIPYTNDISKFTHLKSVKDLHYKDNVYCVSEPETHTMTLLGGILTGQCVGYAVGRFHEIAGDPTFSLVSPINAENIYANGISKGLKASQTPQLGAIAVWQKGPTLSSSDGCGHVAIVEVINADGSIITSESGYGSPIPFQTYKRVKGKDGNWGNGSGYKFLGFLLQPQTVNPDTFTPYTIRLKYGEPIYQISDGVAKQVSMITVESIYTIVYEETLGVEKYGKLKSGVGWVLLESNVTDLKRGSTGDDVKWLQQRLIDKGYMSKGEVDGSFGKKTMSGVLGFQFDNNLEMTGVCDVKTRELLKK